jgi:1-deoxy-D-xylulose-5-phosphate synthase
VFERRLPVVVVEDNSIVGGFGSAVIELASSRGCPVDKVRRIGVPDAFVEHDSPEALREKLGLTAQGIAEAVRTLVAGRAVRGIAR